MRWLVSAVLFLVILSGCAYKDSSLLIQPYKADFIHITQKPEKIYIKNIIDERENRGIIAIITDSQGDNYGYETSDTNFIKWYEDALKKALELNGYEIVNSSCKADETIELRIEKILSTFDRSNLTKANLFGDIKLSLTIEKGTQTITKEISEHIKSYTPIIADKEDFINQIEILLNDSIKMIVKGLDED